MALDAMITAEVLNTLPPDVKKEYTAGEDGMFSLAVKPFKSADGKRLIALEDVGGLRSALESERTNSATLSTRVKAFEGLDPVVARKAITDVEVMKSWTPDEKVRGKLTDLEGQLTTKFTGMLNAEKEVNTKLRSAVDRVLIKSAVQSALAKHQGSEALLLREIMANCRVEQDENGEFVARVVNAQGGPRVSMRPNSSGPMSIDELVETYKGHEDYKAAFKTTVASGSGGTGTQGREGQFTISDADSRDTVKYRQAKAAADKAGVELVIVANS